MRTGARGGAFDEGGGPANAGGLGRTSASVTAPSSGVPTALFAGLLRPKPRPPPVANDGMMVKVGRVTPVVIPPGQAIDPTSLGALELSRFSHSIRPRSVSIVKILSELPPTNPSIRNPL